MIKFTPQSSMISDLLMTPNSLKEISARVVKTNGIPYGPKILPRTLIQYLNSSNCCVNPNCKGKIKEENSLKIKLYVKRLTSQT